MATAAGVEKKDQCTGVERVEQHAHQQLLRRQRILAQPMVHRQPRAALEQDQRQAQAHDRAEVAGIEEPGVTQDGKNVHRIEG
ncbi:hypothetical protein D3C77_679630 [compost metagenome]